MTVTLKEMVKKIAAGAAVFMLALVMSSASKTYANEYSQQHAYPEHYNSYGYGGGIQLMMIPSVDYNKSAFMQQFNYQNDVNFANRTNVYYTTSQASENYNQGYNLNHNQHSNDFGASFGVNSLFMWLSGLLKNHHGNMWMYM